jgi:hypothetical protein
MKNEVQVVEQQQPGMITPAGSITDAIEQFNLYQKLKTQLGQPNDFQVIKGKPHPKKSFVRKVQRFFNISCELIKEEPLKEDGKIIAWLVIARATHQATGAFQDGDGACTYQEKIEKRIPATLNNIRSHATTRAKNRAILDLVGFGDVSAEEINEGSYDPEPQPPQPTEEERKAKGIKAMYTEASNKGLTKPEQKAILKDQTQKNSAKDLSLDELIRMYNFFKNTSAGVLKETAQSLLNPENLQETKVYDVDPETGEATEVIQGGAA